MGLAWGYRGFQSYNYGLTSPASSIGAREILPPGTTEGRGRVVSLKTQLGWTVGGSIGVDRQGELSGDVAQDLTW